MEQKTEKINLAKTCYFTECRESLLDHPTCRDSTLLRNFQITGPM